jgi:hypothetical protein
MTWPRHDEDFLPTDDDTDSTTDYGSDSLFDESDDDTDDAEIRRRRTASFRILPQRIREP